MKCLARSLLVLSLASLPLLAGAAPLDARTRSSVNLRSGPDTDYPRVAMLRAGAPVQVHGCLRDRSWCDVASGGRRGWMAAGYLESVRGDRRLRLDSGDDSLGVVLLDFLLGDYWDSHYRDQSWYRDRDRYAQRHPQHARPPAGNRARPGAPGQHRPPPGQRPPGRPG